MKNSQRGEPKWLNLLKGRWLYLPIYCHRERRHRLSDFHASDRLYIGEKPETVTHTIISEDAFSLYGFNERGEGALFTEAVKRDRRLGRKGALAILGSGSQERSSSNWKWGWSFLVKFLGRKENHTPDYSRFKRKAGRCCAEMIENLFNHEERLRKANETALEEAWSPQGSRICWKIKKVLLTLKKKLGWQQTNMWKSITKTIKSKVMLWMNSSSQKLKQTTMNQW